MNTVDALIEAALHEQAVAHADNSTVIQYALQEMMKKRVSPQVAAKRTATKLNGGTNMFIDPSNPTDIDPKKLEQNIWDYLVDKAVSLLPRVRVDNDSYDYPVGATAQTFSQQSNAKFKDELTKRVEKRLGKSIVQYVQDRG
jgi:hypothetical protein